LLAVVSAVGLGFWRGLRLGLDPDKMFSLAFWMFVPGLVGARLFYVIQGWSAEFYPSFQRSFWSGVGAVLNVPDGGLVVFGCFAGAVAGLLAFVWYRRLPLLAICDLVAPSLALAQGIGRIGCLMNGCCYGAICDQPWALTFPPKSPPYVDQLQHGQLFGFALPADYAAPPRIESLDRHSPLAEAGAKAGEAITAIGGTPVATSGEAQSALLDLYQKSQPMTIRVDGRSAVTLKLPERSLAIHPTQIYSAIDGIVLCLLLLAYEPFRRRDGELFALLLTLHPISRFLLEMIRGDRVPVLGTGLRISQNLSVLFLVAAAMLWVYVLTRPRGRAFWDRPPNVM
jgi:phosphatidylglycerol---prolipoprotein diacylglyceryl transferase